MSGFYNTLDALLYAYSFIDRWAKMGNPNPEDEKDYEVKDG